MQAKFPETLLMCSYGYPALLHVLPEPLEISVINKSMKTRELRVRVDAALKDQFHSGFCGSHLTVGKRN